MFAGCENLELDISNFRIHKDTNTEGIFDKCNSLRKIYVNNEIKERILSEIGKAKMGKKYRFQLDKETNIGNDKIAIEISY